MSTQVVVRISDAGWQWSGQFNINANANNSDADSSHSEVCLRLRNTTDNTILFLQVQASTQHFNNSDVANDNTRYITL
jgi:hypothetical protein